MRLRAFLLPALAVSAGLGVYVVRSHANPPGDALYTQTDRNEWISYARVIRLEHSGSANGRLLATFERWHGNADPTTFLIQQSLDDGHTWAALANVSDGETGPTHPWPVMWQPFLFELPRRLGRYPAGTLLLAGNVCPKGIPESHFQLWRSADHGATWQYVSTFQKGGSVSPGRGIWEPYLALDKRGRLVCYFSDERQSEKYSQFLGHIVSEDGGDTWGPEVMDVASASQPDRPGMATVARLRDGTYLMSYEICGPLGCEVRVKASRDGDTWGDAPTDLGTRPETTDGRYLVGSPYLVRASGPGRDGRLMLAAHEARLVTGGVAPETGQVVFLNANSGQGQWSWMPAPFKPAYEPRGHTNPVYSPCLLPSSDGKSLRVTVPSGGEPSSQERTGTGPADILPYTDRFAAGSDAGWIDYAGDWSVRDGEYRVAAGNGEARAIAGSTGWTDYTVSADIKLASPGEAGLLFRVTDPNASAYHGYAVRLSSRDGTLCLMAPGTQAPPTSVAVPGGIAAGVWYHMTAKANGSVLEASLQREGARDGTSRVRATDSASPMGAIGLNSWSTACSWKNVRVGK